MALSRAGSVLAVAGDPGGAAALLPVLRRLPPACLQVAAYRQALPLLSALAPVEALPEALPDDPAGFCADFLARRGARLLLCATSVNGTDWERRLVAAANAVGIKSLAVLDSWSNPRPRFVLDGRLVVPTVVTAIDTLCRDGLVAAGLPPEVVRITGQPALDSLGERPPLTAPQRRELRAGLGLGEGDRLLLFVSQPLAAMRRLPGIADPGYDEFVVLDQLTAALVRRVEAGGERVALLIRPHPREDAVALRRYERDGACVVRLHGGGDPHALAQAADLVVGMNSWFLVEAAQLGCPVLSLQPGLIGEDPLATNRDGRTRAVYTAAGLADALGEMLRAGTTAPRPAPDAAAARVVELIAGLMA